VLARLDGQIAVSAASDAALIVSELVTNSVRHANVGAHETLILELTRLGDQLRVAVTDPGSELLPRVLPVDDPSPGGFGLRLVDGLASDWGVARTNGKTRVWCDLPLWRVPTA
jgi:anti-sigma regulatory factor (Ser/Thr protein kinase)